MDDDWKSQFMPEAEEDHATSDGMPELSLADLEEVDLEGAVEAVLTRPPQEGPEAQLAVVLGNQQRIMEAVDNMAAGFSQQLVILARRIDNFERILEQSLGQPTMTNLMFDAPEVFEKVINRDDTEDEVLVDDGRATEAKVPAPSFQVPDEVDHLLNFDPDFPVSIEVQVAFHMWKEKHATFQAFVKAAGGPVLAKQAREHLE
jgi:hypothetical protein